MRDSGGRLAIVLHIYYLDIADRLLSQLRWLAASDRFALWVTAPTEKRADVEALLARHGLVAHLRAYPNVGMDVLPFLRVLPELGGAGYSAVVKLHTKRGADEVSAVWGAALLDEMCRQPVLEAIDQAFEQHADLDLAGLGPFYLSAKRLRLRNEQLVKALTNDLVTLPTMPPTDWGFFAGTVFGARLERLLPLARWAEKNLHYFASVYASDGLYEHALERVFGLVARQQKRSVGLIHNSPASHEVALQRIHLGESINQAYSRELARQIEPLASDYVALTRCDLLDTRNYMLEGKVTGSVDVHRHYLLIGQFDQRVLACKAWSLKQYNERKLPWDRWSTAPRDLDLVSVIVPVFNQPELTEQCIRSLFSVKTDVRYEVVCVDNGSDAATGSLLAALAYEFPGLCLVSHASNLNFALGCNTGFGHSRGARVVFLNNDTTVTDGWLDRLMARLDVGDCFAVQPQLRYPDGTVQCMGVVFSDKSTLGYPIYAKMAPWDCAAEKPRTFKALTAACLALNANDFAMMKGFDALYINGQEDVDLCLRLHEHTGKLGAYVPDSVVVHHESKSEGRGTWIAQNRRVFLHRWQGRVVADDQNYYREDGFVVQDWTGDRHPEPIRVYRPVLEPLVSSDKPRVEALTLNNSALLAGLNSARPEQVLPTLLARARSDEHFVEFNELCLDLARRRWLQSRLGQLKPRIGISGWCLSDNAAGRALTLAEAYAPHADAEVIGCILPAFGEALWAPMRESAIPCHYFTVRHNQEFVRQALDLVVQHPYDIIHLSKPRIHNVVIGWLYQLVWGARVIVDVDDEELGFVGAESPLDPFDYIRTEGGLPPLADLRSKDYTRLAVGMVDQFDSITVSNPALQQRYGGQVIPHVRPLARFKPSQSRRATSRARFGLPHDKQIVLFFGTPRKRKGVVETARALAALGRDDLLYVIAGGEPDAELKSELNAIAGLPIVYLGSQPYDQVADVVAVADACVLLQDVADLAAQYQLPAKLIDALGMGVTVFAHLTPALADLAEKGAFIPVTRTDLSQKLQVFFEGGYPGQRAKGRAVFESELSVEAVSPIIRALVADTAPRRATQLSWEGQVTQVIQQGQLPLGVPLPRQEQ